MVSQTGSRTCIDVSYVHPKECCDMAVTALDLHVSIPIQGSLTQTTIFRTLIGMAVMQQSVHSISTLLEKSPCETSLRYHLAKLRMDELEAVNTAWLMGSLPSSGPERRTRLLLIIPMTRITGRFHRRTRNTSAEVGSRNRRTNSIPTLRSMRSPRTAR